MDKLAQAFADLAAQYGPAVGDAALAAARIEAYSMLASTFLGFTLAAVAAITATRLRRFMNTCNDADAGALWIPICALWGAAAVAGGIAVGVWIDPWTWTALNHPEVWLAKKAFRIGS